MAILKDTTYCSTRHLRAILPVLFTAFAFRLASAQPLSVSPVSADLGRFPAWKSQTQTFAVRNTGESTVHLLRVRSSCGCLAADFQPCTLEAGQKTAVTVTIPANSVSGEFSKTVFLETDAPGQEFLKLTVSGTAVPAVEVQPKREVYLGRLEAGKPHSFMFRLVPASPGMSPKLLPADEGEGQADAALSRDDNDGSFTLELTFTPDASRRYVAIGRKIAIEWKHDIPPLTLAAMFTVRDGAGK